MTKLFILNTQFPPHNEYFSGFKNHKASFHTEKFCIILSTNKRH